MCPRRLGDLDATEHSRQFLDAILGRELTHLRAARLAIGQFDDAEVMRALACDLRQVRHA